MLKERDQRIVELNDSLSGTSLLVSIVELFCYVHVYVEDVCMYVCVCMHVCVYTFMFCMYCSIHCVCVSLCLL